MVRNLEKIRIRNELTSLVMGPLQVKGPPPESGDWLGGIQYNLSNNNLFAFNPTIGCLKHLVFILNLEDPKPSKYFECVEGLL